MAEKRYYWLKLKEDYFNNPKIKKLRKIAGGDTFTIIYLKMQLLSISNNGIITFEQIENTFEEELALKLDEQLEDVQLTLAYLKTQGLIENNDNDFLLSEACKNIGSEVDSAERVRKFREKKKQELLHCNNDVTNLYISNSISNSNNKEFNILSEYNFSKNVEETIKIWLQYKKEKGQTYKKTGLNILLTRLNKEIEKNGEDFVINNIKGSIANNWAGIYECNYKNSTKSKDGCIKTREYTNEQLNGLFDNLEETDI